MNDKADVMVQDWFDATTRVGRAKEDLLRAEQHQQQVENTLGRKLAPTLVPGDKVSFEVDLPGDKVVLEITCVAEGYTLMWRSGCDDVGVIKNGEVTLLKSSRRGR